MKLLILKSRCVSYSIAANIVLDYDRIRRKRKQEIESIQ